MTDEKQKYYKVTFLPPNPPYRGSEWVVTRFKDASTQNHTIVYDMKTALGKVKELEAEGYIKCPI